MAYPKPDGPVDKNQFTQFRRAMRQLGIQMIAAYSREVRGRCERQFGTHQGRIPFELEAQSITEMEEANEDILND